MSDTPQASPGIQAVESDALKTVQEAMLLYAAFKKDGVSGVAKLAGEALPIIRKDVADVVAVIPEVKAGYKSTEFWMAAVASAGLLYSQAHAGGDVNPWVAGAIAAITGIYSLVRGAHKIEATKATA